MKIKSILIAILAIFFCTNGSFAKDKEKINALKEQLSEKLNHTFRNGSYSESVLTYTKGSGTNQINLIVSSNDSDEDLNLSFYYKLNFSNIERVDIASLKDNTEEACAIRIHLKKPSKFTYLQHKPRFVKEKRNVYSILIQASSKRSTLIEARDILLQLADECQ